MADAGKMIMTLGVVGVGGYVIYEYSRYNSALNTISSSSYGSQTALATQAYLPFLSYLMAGFSLPTDKNALGAYNLIQGALAGTLGQATQAPGTTSSGQTTQTSVSGSANTSTAAQAAMPQPTAADLQKVLNASTGTADQWNWAYHQLTGYGIEQLYGADFDVIYGAADSSGVRSTGIITAGAFLQMPLNKGLKRVASLSGLGAIARFYTPVVNSMASMVYRAQHPSPYRFPVGSGLGAFTQASGFEKALWAGRFLRGNKIL